MKIKRDSPADRPLKKPCPTAEGIPNLPQEIIVEILARLSVKDLIRFKCVAKSWRSLISSAPFIKLHLAIATDDNAFSGHRIVSTIFNPGYNLNHCSIRSLMYEPSAVGFEIDYPMKHPHMAVWVVGSCNGLICIVIDDKDLFLWNPSTRVSIKLPPAGVNLNPCFYHVYGFGYNESTDDYNVLGIFYVFGHRGVNETDVKLYSLRTNSWKTIGDFSGGVPLDDSGKFANGKLHFPVTKDLGVDFRWDIVSLDLDSEAYANVEQPNYGEGQFETSLGVLGGCVCVISNHQKTYADLWVLKEYGVKESWAKVAVFGSGDPENYLHIKPLLILPSGEIFLLYGRHIVIYDPKDDSLRNTSIGSLSSCIDADFYVESLVSPVVHEN